MNETHVLPCPRRWSAYGPCQTVDKLTDRLRGAPLEAFESGF